MELRVLKMTEKKGCGYLIEKQICALLNCFYIKEVWGKVFG